MPTPIQARPVLKWAGGKQALAEQIVGFFPTTFTRYYEPFVGGGSILLRLEPARAIIGDQNAWLLDTYEALRSDHERVARILDGMVNSREEYARIRAVPPDSLELFQRAAHFIYLNKTCFRGLYRVNREGRFNVPYGAYNRRYYDPENLAAFARCLQSVEIRHADFVSCLVDVTRDDFLYLDPPYHRLGGYSDFNRYTAAQFREHDHVRLAAVCRKLDARGVRWAVSNSDTELVRGLFDGYNLIPISSRREINLKTGDRKMTELLITNDRTGQEARLGLSRRAQR